MRNFKHHSTPVKKHGIENNKTCLLAPLLVVAGVSNNPACAQSTTAATEIGAYGMVGIASGQTARLNVYMPPGPPAVPANAIITTFEVIDNATNKTVLLYHPPSPCRESGAND